MDNVNGFRCECETGFSGHNCEGLAEIQCSIKIILIDIDKFNDHNNESLRMLITNAIWKVFQIYFFLF